MAIKYEDAENIWFLVQTYKEAIEFLPHSKLAPDITTEEFDAMIVRFMVSTTRGMINPEDAKQLVYVKRNGLELC